MADHATHVKKYVADADDKKIPQIPGLFQIVHMADVKKVETAIGEADALALRTPFTHAVVGNAPVECDLFFRRERRRLALFDDLRRLLVSFAS